MNTDHGPELFTGGTDQRVRKWNMTSPSESYIAMLAASDVMKNSSYSYEYEQNGLNVLNKLVNNYDFYNTGVDWLMALTLCKRFAQNLTTLL